MLLGRFRSYYFPSKLHTYIRRQLSQAVLFTLAEYLPTIAILLGSLLVLMLPLLLTDINLIAQYIALRFFHYGIPLILITLIILALFAPIRWVVRAGEKLTIPLYKGKFTLKTSAMFGYFVIVLLLLSPVAWRLLEYGIKNPISHQMVTHYRGHGDVMVYHDRLQNKTDDKIDDKLLSPNETKIWQISPTKG